MAVYNGAPFLSAAIDSVLAQSFRDFELVIVDDASTDDTGEILASYTDPRLVLLRSPSNLGLTRSLNIGLRAARGRYVARMDADDVADPERLRLQTAFLDWNSDHVLVGAGYREIDTQGTPLRTVRKPMDDVELRWVSQVRTALEHSTVTFRRTGPDGAAFFYDERYRTAQDAELWLRLLQHGKGAALDAVLLDYRVHGDRVSVTAAADQRTSMLEACVEHAIRAYRLDEDQQHWVRELLTFCNGGNSAEMPGLRGTVRGLALLQKRFIASRRLSPKEQRLVRSRGAGQLWHAALRRQRLDALRTLRLMWIARATLPWLGWRLVDRALRSGRPTPQIECAHTRRWKNRASSAQAGRGEMPTAPARRIGRARWV